MEDTKHGTPAQGATVPPMTEQQFRKALEDDFAMLHAMINFIRCTPRLLDVMAQVTYETSQNTEAVKKAQIALALERQS